MPLLRQEELPLDSTVLKVAHHGAGAATSKRFLEAVTPQVAVISVGAGNRFGHPSPEVLARLREVGVQVWRTAGLLQTVAGGLPGVRVRFDLAVPSAPRTAVSSACVPWHF